MNGNQEQEQDLNQANPSVTEQVTGLVVRGYQVASGQAKNSPYPKGSIALQLPFFKRLGVDLSGCLAATINVDISPFSFSINDADFHLKNVNWIGDIYEDFFIDQCQLQFKNKSYSGFIYYPHPATKPDHFHSATIVEVVCAPIPEIHYGDRVTLVFNSAHIKLA